MSYFSWVVFFFQAEDGIRDLVRSRGLGDVYKRQHIGLVGRRDLVDVAAIMAELRPPHPRRQYRAGGAVSYTHLTLPTSDLV